MQRGYNLYIKERGYCILTLLSRFHGVGNIDLLCPVSDDLAQFFVIHSQTPL